MHSHFVGFVLSQLKLYLVDIKHRNEKSFIKHENLGGFMVNFVTKITVCFCCFIIFFVFFLRYNLFSFARYVV